MIKVRLLTFLQIDWFDLFMSYNFLNYVFINSVHQKCMRSWTTIIVLSKSSGHALTVPLCHGIILVVWANSSLDFICRPCHKYESIIITFYSYLQITSVGGNHVLFCVLFAIAWSVLDAQICHVNILTESSSI